ncbi:hypothetical protein MCOR25_008646 [Pyricularia grisea]|uniref:Mitochondrial division protein 1 n=1 Tax=Pyricularia grisea TaxID=148305 RepID=A0A6P8B8C4_PYRGI|nr:uncharacterized protein PgNI_03055 [Pyricularia grisea]KAI6354351.1 hypothetical protein MCOR25_008646 [Pyricularia grisea]TLD12119.1 hypothetical protein PgNI_03055 [Pyricularia grisea]
MASPSASPALDANPAEPPSKRRRVVGDASNEEADGAPSPETSASHQELSIRTGRPDSRSRSGSPKEDDDARRSREKRSYSRTQSPRSRSRSRPTSRSRSRSHSRSRSTSRSSDRRRSRSRRDSSSRSRSRSRSRSESRSRSRSRTRYRSTGSSPTPAAESKPPERVRVRYKRRLELRGHSQPIAQVRISPNGRWIASASADGTARIWDAETGAHIDTLVGHMAGVSCLAWSPDSGTLATGSDDKAIRLWDRITAEPAHAVGTEDGDDDAERGRTHGGTRISGASGIGVGGGGGPARGTRRPLLGHHNYVYCLAFSPKGNILASGSYDEAVFLWDVRAGRLMRSLPAHSDPVSGIDFCRDGTLVVSCSTDGLIRIWDTATGQCLRTLVHEDNPAVTNVCFSPNGRYILAFNLDSCIRLWDYIAHPSKVKKTYQGHVNTGFSIGGCFGVVQDGEEEIEDEQQNGEDGDQDEDEQDRHPRRKQRQSRQQAFVASASEDGHVVLWDVKSKEVVQKIAAHDGVCFWVDVVGDTMVSAGKDARILVYRNTLNSQRQKMEGETNGVNVTNGVEMGDGVEGDGEPDMVNEEAREDEAPQVEN